jgi:hypothetical protein
MTMFSMKPKFDLAEFLAVTVPAGAARTRGMRRRGMQFRPQASSQEAVEAKQPKDTGATDQSED